jgi:membrane-associated phospholipid phosphatase
VWRHRSEIAWAALVLLSFPVVAALSAGLGPVAMENGARLMAVEARLGIGGEAAIAAWTQVLPALAVPAELLYVWMHVPVTIGALGWACLRRPESYRRLRSAFLGAHAVTLTLYLAVPVAPPWMMAGPGSRAHDDAGLGGLAHLLQSPYAAMPSGHVLWAVIAAIAAWACVEDRRARAAVAAYPPFVALLTVATGNHHWADVAAGAAIAAVAVAATTVRPQPAVAR